jgi:predicted DNA binding protein
MYYAKMNVYHNGGLCNIVSCLSCVRKCFIDRADVLSDGSVYIELSVNFSKKKKETNFIENCLTQVSDEISIIDIMNMEKSAKLRYIIGPDANSVIRETNKMGFILDFPIIVEKEKEVISGIVVEDRSLKSCLNLFKKANFNYKIKKIVKKSKTNTLSYVKWSWSLSNEVHLTNMQRKVIYTAFENEYYSFPRKTDIKSISEIVGLSTSTTWEHLRKAEMKIMNHVLEEDLLSNGFI